MPAERIRIIFVDDEPNILDSLQRSLRKKKQLWDMCFVTSGKAVLKLCEKSPYHNEFSQFYKSMKFQSLYKTLSALPPSEKDTFSLKLLIIPKPRP